MKTAITQQHIGNKIDWTKADEPTLVTGALARNESAWLELLRRYDATINKRVKFVVSRCWRSFRSSDTFDDIKAEVYLALTTNNMGRLRAFDPKLGNLTKWISMIAQHAALNHLQKLTRRPMPDPLDAFLEDEEHDDQRGARWIAEGL